MGVPVRLPAGLRYAIAVTPDLEAGDTGWCSGPQFTLPGERTRLIGGGSACAPASARAVTIVAGGAGLTNILSSLRALQPATRSRGAFNPANIQAALSHTTSISLFVVSDRVAQIRVGRAWFVPRPDSELAPGWRAVVIFTRGLLGTFELLDHHGQLINQNDTPEVPAVPVTTVNPRHLPPAVCSLTASKQPGVASQWEVVADRAPRRRLAPRGAMFSCARAWYAIPSQHAVYSAAILLNAQNPAHKAPSLPGLTPTPTPGDYQEAAAAGGQIAARRVANAWLVVQGPQPQQRTSLLNQIKVAGTAIQR